MDAHGWINMYISVHTYFSTFVCTPTFCMKAAHSLTHQRPGLDKVGKLQTVLKR